MMAALDSEAPLVHLDPAPTAFTWGFSAVDYEAPNDARRVVAPGSSSSAFSHGDGAARGGGRPDSGPGEFTLWTFDAGHRTSCLLISSFCGIPEQKLRRLRADVGVGFGWNLNVYADEAIALAVARRLGAGESDRYPSEDYRPRSTVAT